MACTHPVLLHSLCAKCGEVVTPTNVKLYSPLPNNDTIRMTKPSKISKPVLVIDLDHTILQTSLSYRISEENGNDTGDKIPRQFTFTLEPFAKQIYTVRTRPFLRNFLSALAPLYELRVYTMGTRDYASALLRTLDPQHKYFDGRVTTRDENNSKLVKELGRIGVSEKKFLVVDDRWDVWGYSSNVILVRPFRWTEEVDFNDPGVILSAVDDVKCDKTDDTSVITNNIAINLENEIIPQETILINNTPIITTPVPPLIKNPLLPLRASKDKYLLTLKKLLIRLHKSYTHTQDIKKALQRKRNKLFVEYKFYARNEAENVLKACGASFFECANKIAENMVLVRSGDSVMEVHTKWIFECVWKMKKVNINSFVVRRDVVVESVYNRLEDEIFDL